MSNTRKTDTALQSARARHRRLDDQVDRRQRLKFDDPYALQTLKKQRLAAKDRMAGLASRVGADTAQRAEAVGPTA